MPVFSVKLPGFFRGETRDDWEGGKGKGRREAPGAEEWELVH